MKFNYDDSNVFAKILSKSIPSTNIFENESVLAFKTIEPEYDHHVLVIPKKPYVSYAHFVREADQCEIADFFKSIDEVAKKMKIEDSYKLITNHGKHVGQEVFHFHVHLVRDN